MKGKRIFARKMIMLSYEICVPVLNANEYTTGAYFSSFKCQTFTQTFL